MMVESSGVFGVVALVCLLVSSGCHESQKQSGDGTKKPSDEGASRSLRSDEDVRAAYKRATGRTLGDCINRPNDLPGIILVGSFASDLGCMPEGIFVGGEYVEWDKADAAGLAHLGWAKADPKRRRELAKMWLDRVVLAYGGDLEERSSEDFERSDTPAFTAPSVESRPDGSVIVTGWVADPAGMVRETTYRLKSFSFGPDGSLSVRELDRFTATMDPPPTPAAPKGAGLTLDLDVSVQEHSRDANSQHYRVKVDGLHVTYQGPFGKGSRGHYSTRKVTFELSEAEAKELSGAIESGGLLQKVRELHKKTPSAPYHSIDATVRLSLEGKKGRLRLLGAFSDLKHADLARTLEGLGRRFKRLADSHG